MNETKYILKKRPEVFVWNNLQNNDAMTDNGREALRIPPFTTGSPVPGPRPDKVPETETETPLPRTVRIKFKGENASRWGKPEGVHSLECRWIIARSPPGLIEELVHSEFATRSLLELVFDENKRGARLYFAVRWEGGNGKKGPWSEIFSVVIP
jgi:hypothetical protein